MPEQTNIEETRRNAACLIYYFSGPGNSLWTAKELAAALPNSTLINIALEIRQEEIIAEAEKLIFVFPAYAYGLPEIVRRFIQRARIRADYTAAAVTYGSSPGGTLSEVSRLLRRKGRRLDLAARIPAVENFIPIFGAPKDATRKKRLVLQREATEQAQRRIAAGERNSAGFFNPLAKLVSLLFRLYRPNIRKFYRVSDSCTGCGLCVRICPVGAVSLAGNNRPVFSGDCEVCQACLNRCPARAINFARMKENGGRYYHPEITVI
jgi:ferredoxin